jgi:hypothetical protein
MISMIWRVKQDTLQLTCLATVVLAALSVLANRSRRRGSGNFVVITGSRSGSHERRHGGGVDHGAALVRVDG